MRRFLPALRPLICTLLLALPVALGIVLAIEAITLIRTGRVPLLIDESRAMRSDTE